MTFIARPGILATHLVPGLHFGGFQKFRTFNHRLSAEGTLVPHLRKCFSLTAIILKTLIFISTILFFTSCYDKQRKTNKNAKNHSFDTLVKHDTIYVNNDNNWQQNFGLTHDPEQDTIWGKPVKFYIENPNCSPIAIDFYQGQFRPTDNNTTAALLNLVTTNDNKLRPFYRWCLNKTIQIQDGALGEYTGVPARKYAEKFPVEFFKYMDYDTTGDKYLDWVNSILYSGFYDIDDYRKPKEIRARMTNTMKKNCENCNDSTLKRIDKFVIDCFQ
jgi:hypothetical protein